jgi:hypothetical protein
MKAIREGVNFVIPMENLKIFTWEEVETRACGDKCIDTEKLKKMTEYYVVRHHLMIYFIEWRL